MIIEKRVVRLKEQGASPLTHQERRSDIPSLGGWYDTNSPRLTINSGVWPSLINYDVSGAHNGFDLMDNTPSQLDKSGLAQDAVCVAFDLPESLVQKLALIHGIAAQPMDEVHKSGCYHFCGFDIVDIRTTSSFFYSFNWETAEITEILNKNNLRLNSWGIIDDEADAIKAACAFDKIIPEHAPFAPCGVWLSSA